LLDEVIEVVVVSANEKERISEGMEEDFFERLEYADADSGEELKGKPSVEHGRA